MTAAKIHAPSLHPPPFGLHVCSKPESLFQRLQYMKYKEEIPCVNSLSS